MMNIFYTYFDLSVSSATYEQEVGAFWPFMMVCIQFSV